MKRIHHITKPQAALLVQGALAIVFGVAAMAWPGITTMTLAYLFAAFLVIDGGALLLMGFAWRARRTSTRVWWGLVQLLLGVYVLYNPDVTLAALIMILGLTLMVRGAFNITHSLLWTHEPFAERAVHGAMGLLGVIIGTVIAVQPAAGGLSFVWILGLYAVATGAALTSLGLGVGRQRQHHH